MADFGTIARPYARAIFEIADAVEDLSGWSDALAAAAAVVAAPGARAYLGQPGLSSADRAAFVWQIANGIPGSTRLVTPEGKNLLSLLAENDRLGALPEIAAQFEALKTEAERKIKVTLVSATPVEPAVTEQLSRSLEKRFGRSVELGVEVDGTLLGGAVIRAEDMVIDGSVRSRLQRLADILVD
jgi:F-type H+-transporting ATPase subunit delta